MIVQDCALARAIAITVVLFCCCVESFAQNEKDSTELKKIALVAIEGVKGLSQLNSAVPMQRLEGADLRQMSSLSVADALRYFSGVQLKDYGGVGGLKTVNVKSLGTNHTNVFYNGLLISNAQNGQVDLGKYSLGNLEEITLFAGQNTEELLPAKAYSSASGLFLKSRRPVFMAKNILNQQYGIKVGHFGLINASAAVDFKITPKLMARVDADFAKAHGKYKYRYTNGVYDTTVVRQNGDVLFSRLEATVFQELGVAQKLQYQFYYYESERGLPGAIVSNRYQFSQRLWDRNLFAQLQYENKPSDNYKFNVQGKFARDYSRYIDPDYKKIEGFLDNRYQQKSFYLTSAHLLKLGERHAISLSADYSYDQLEANLYNFAFPNRQQFLLALAKTYNSEKVKIDVGLLATYVRDHVKVGATAGRKNAYTPNISINYLPFQDKNLSLRAFYKSSFRLPTFNDLYYTFVGNHKLNPELAKQLNVGVTFSRPMDLGSTVLQLDADVYFNKVSDKIVAIPTLNLFRWTMVNLDEVEIKGANLGLTISNAWRNFRLQSKLNYTYEQALDKTIDGTAYNHQIPYIPEHSGSFRLQIGYKDWGLNYAFIYTGSRYSQKANIPENRVPAWNTHDLSARKSFNIREHHFRIAFEVNNLMNHYYDVILNYPMPGRNFRANFQVNF